MKTFSLIIALWISLPAFAQDPAAEVDPFIGTANGGNTFPGAVCPWGMVSVSPHTAPGAPSGYLWDRKQFSGFGHVHLSGTGCSELGSVILSAARGLLRLDPAARTCTIDSQQASPGYYRAELLEPGLLAEATATIRCGLTRFTSHEEGEVTLFLNAGQSLSLTGGGAFALTSPSEAEGYNISGGFCGEANRETIFFSARFSREPDSSGLWIGSHATGARQISAPDSVLGGWFRFKLGPADTLLVKVGISYVSARNAWLNIEEEIPDWDFGRVLDAARAAWNLQLSRVLIEGGTHDDRVKFYTALYHMLIHPNVITDFNGDYPLMGRQGTGHYRERERYSVFSLWDTYRTLHPFLTLAYPRRQSAILRTMVDMYHESGWLPKWELAGNETYMMVGDPAVPVIADSYLKGIRDFDVQAAYEAMGKPSLATGDTAPPIRPGYHEYLRYGYIPFEQDTTLAWWVWGPVSTTLEYALDDWCFAQMARSLGAQADATTFERRSRYCRNLFDPSTLLVRPKRRDGSWLTPFNPLATEGSGSWAGSGGPGFVEGNAWQYTWFMPHDIQALIGLFGGRKQFSARLNECFANGQFTINNEPDIAYPYLFTCLPGEERRSDELVRGIMAKDFGTGPGGLPGNDDAGTISGWYVFSALGLYPACPGSGTYQLCAPLFPRATIALDPDYYPGGELTIERSGSSAPAGRLASIELNGEKITGRTLEHSALVRGGTLAFTFSTAR